jgi:hypothetical protein
MRVAAGVGGSEMRAALHPRGEREREKERERSVRGREMIN